MFNEENKMKKELRDMTKEEKSLCFKHFVHEQNIDIIDFLDGDFDNYDGFCFMMQYSTFNVYSGECISSIWPSMVSEFFEEERE